MGVGLVEFDRRWSERWAGLRPVGRELKSARPELRTPLHTLPGGRRYPADDRELAEILQRHHAILQMLAEGTLIAVTCSWSESSAPVPRHWALEQAAPRAIYWRSDDLATEPGFHSWQHTFISSAAGQDLDALLTLVALDQTDDVILTDRTLTWLYHPYDGGADLIAPDNLRTTIARTYPDWLAAA